VNSTLERKFVSFAGLPPRLNALALGVIRQNLSEDISKVILTELTVAFKDNFLTVCGSLVVMAACSA